MEFNGIIEALAAAKKRGEFHLWRHCRLLIMEFQFIASREQRVFVRLECVESKSRQPKQAEMSREKKIDDEGGEEEASAEACERSERSERESAKSFH